MRGSKLVTRQRNACSDVGQLSESFDHLNHLSSPSKKTKNRDLAFSDTLEDIFPNQWEAKVLSNSKCCDFVGTNQQKLVNLS
jgi:hypothetical protein